MPHTEQSLRNAGAECYWNASELHKSAEFLLGRDRLEHALALASIGMEEFAKSLVYTVGALRPDQRGQIGDKIGGHHAKRWVFSQARSTVMMLRQSGRECTENIRYRPTHPEHLVEYFVDLAKSGLEGLLMTDSHAREQYIRLNQGGLIPAELKEAALYVDLKTDGTLRVPRGAARAPIYADMHVKLLSGQLFQFAALPGVLTDDIQWESFAEAVRHRI